MRLLEFGFMRFIRIEIHCHHRANLQGQGETDADNQFVKSIHGVEVTLNLTGNGKVHYCIPEPDPMQNPSRREKST